MQKQTKNKKGRPTVVIKDLTLKCRIDAATFDELMKCSLALNKNKSEVVRFAISGLYDRIRTKTGSFL